MPSGGARARSGPAPDPLALRRDRKDDASWLTLPSEGRTGPVPAWPLELCTEAEKDMWTQLWSQPVALLWERDRQERNVALYVRNYLESQEFGASAAYRTLSRQLAGELLLTMPAMLAARVRIASDEVAEKRDSSAKEPKRSSARDRMTVVSDAEGA